MAADMSLDSFSTTGDSSLEEVCLTPSRGSSGMSSLRTKKVMGTPLFSDPYEEEGFELSTPPTLKRPLFQTFVFLPHFLAFFHFFHSFSQTEPMFCQRKEGSLKNHLFCRVHLAIILALDDPSQPHPDLKKSTPIEKKLVLVPLGRFSSAPIKKARKLLPSKRLM